MKLNTNQLVRANTQGRQTNTHFDEVCFLAWDTALSTQGPGQLCLTLFGFAPLRVAASLLLALILIASEDFTRNLLL